MKDELKIRKGAFTNERTFANMLMWIKIPKWRKKRLRLAIHKK